MSEVRQNSVRLWDGEEEGQVVAEPINEEEQALEAMLADTGWQVVRKRLEKNIAARKDHLARVPYDTPEKVYELAREQGIIATLENLLSDPKQVFYDVEKAAVQPQVPQVRSSLPKAAQKGHRARPMGM